jgi:hypothetical protein
MSASGREAQVGDWWSYMGYSCTSRGGLSYDCPALKLYGYRNDLQLHRAVKREVIKRNAALLEALEAARDALVNVPTSLGYEDDLMPKIRAAIRAAKGESG